MSLPKGAGASSHFGLISWPTPEAFAKRIANSRSARFSIAKRIANSRSARFSDCKLPNNYGIGNCVLCSVGEFRENSRVRVRRAIERYRAAAQATVTVIQKRDNLRRGRGVEVKHSNCLYTSQNTPPTLTGRPKQRFGHVGFARHGGHLLSPSRPAGWCTRAQFHIHCARDATHRAQLDEAVMPVCGSSRGEPESKRTSDWWMEWFVRRARDEGLTACTHSMPATLRKLSLCSPHHSRTQKVSPSASELRIGAGGSEFNGGRTSSHALRLSVLSTCPP